MATQGQDKERAAAIGWYVRLRDGETQDWEAFVRWLQEDPSRSDLYDAVSAADAELRVDLIPATPADRAANDDIAPEALPRRVGARGWWAAAAGVAAVVLLMILGLPWLTAPSGRYEVATAPGERRAIAFGDGSSAVLNGGTRLVLDRENARLAELVVGEATFTIRPDPAAPFVVTAGDHRVEDVGTAFNLVREPARFSVEVIEGAVRYDSRRQAVTLTAGQTLLMREGVSQPLIGSRRPEMMAGWQRRQLNYSATPLDLVASDLARSLGTDIAIDPALARLPFTGSVRVDRDAAATVPSFASTLGLRASRSGNGWRIEPEARATD